MWFGGDHLFCNTSSLNIHQVNGKSTDFLNISLTDFSKPLSEYAHYAKLDLILKERLFNILPSKCKYYLTTTNPFIKFKHNIQEISINSCFVNSKNEFTLRSKDPDIFRNNSLFNLDDRFRVDGVSANTITHLSSFITFNFKDLVILNSTISMSEISTLISPNLKLAAFIYCQYVSNSFEILSQDSYFADILNLFGHVTTLVIEMIHIPNWIEILNKAKFNGEKILALRLCVNETEFDNIFPNIKLLTEFVDRQADNFYMIICIQNEELFEVPKKLKKHFRITRRYNCTYFQSRKPLTRFIKTNHFNIMVDFRIHDLTFLINPEKESKGIF